MKFRVFVSTPKFLVFRRFDVESDDSESAIEIAKYLLTEMNREDPDAQFWTKETT